MRKGKRVERACGKGKGRGSEGLLIGKCVERGKGRRGVREGVECI